MKIDLTLWIWFTISGTSPFGHLQSIQGTQNLVLENVQIIFVSVTSIEGAPQFRGGEHFFWVPKHGFNLHLGDYTPGGGGRVLP